MYAWKRKAYSNKAFDQQKYSHFRTVTTNKSKHISFQGILTISRGYYEIILSTFSEFIWSNSHTFRELLRNKYYWHFNGVTSTQYYIFSQTSNKIGIFIELLANNTTKCSRFRIFIKQYWHFQRVTGRHYYTLLQGLYQEVVTFSESSH